ncbi:MAG: peptidoglycan DD-metalloendopeptidase family protein [Actinomycetota bacterium]
MRLPRRPRPFTGHDRALVRAPALRAALSAVLVGLVVLVAPAQPAVSDDKVTKQELAGAKSDLARIDDAISAKQRELDGLQAQSDQLAFELDAANGELANAKAQLLEIQAKLDEVKAQYEERVTMLEDRAREAFMAGAGSTVDFLLGASSISDLSDRAEYVDQITAADSDIAAEVGALRDLLADREKELQKLEAERERAVAKLADRQAQMQEQFDAQQALLDQIQAEKAKQEQIVSKLGKQYREQLLAQSGYSGTIGNGVLQACPVDAPMSFGDSFGAPRYTGGYHPHAGNDIFAPMGTPIRATFPGTASVASNTIGGLSVKVTGASGYTYNAHLSALGTIGAVQAGDIIGYVGDSGNAAGTSPHNHFEYHPNAIPANWPKSAYGYAVVGDAINPYPLLSAVC